MIKDMIRQRQLKESTERLEIQTYRSVIIIRKQWNVCISRLLKKCLWWSRTREFKTENDIIITYDS